MKSNQNKIQTKKKNQITIDQAGERKSASTYIKSINLSLRFTAIFLNHSRYSNENPLSFE